MANQKNFEKFQNSIVLKDFLPLIVTFSKYTKEIVKIERMKQIQLDDCKIKILENQGEFDTLAKKISLEYWEQRIKKK